MNESEALALSKELRKRFGQRGGDLIKHASTIIMEEVNKRVELHEEVVYALRFLLDEVYAEFDRCSGPSSADLKHMPEFKLAEETLSKIEETKQCNSQK